MAKLVKFGLGTLWQSRHGSLRVGRVCYDKLRFAEAVGVGQCEARSVPFRFVTAVLVVHVHVGFAKSRRCVFGSVSRGANDRNRQKE